MKFLFRKLVSFESLLRPTWIFFGVLLINKCSDWGNWLVSKEAALKLYFGGLLLHRLLCVCVEWRFHKLKASVICWPAEESGRLLLGQMHRCGYDWSLCEFESTGISMATMNLRIDKSMVLSVVLKLYGFVLSWICFTLSSSILIRNTKLYMFMCRWSSPTSTVSWAKVTNQNQNLLIYVDRQNSQMITVG